MLRRKMEDMEGENERLSNEVMHLQQFAKSSSSSGALAAGSSSDLDTLRNQLMEKNKEIQHLSEALTQAEKTKSKVAVQRNRSLENESALGLKVSVVLRRFDFRPVLDCCIFRVFLNWPLCPALSYCSWFVIARRRDNCSWWNRRQQFCVRKRTNSKQRTRK